MIWTRSNILHDFSGCSAPILGFFFFLRFVCSLAFQRHISNCSTVKIREAMAKIVREVKNDGGGKYCMEREAGGGRSADPGEASFYTHTHS